MKLIGIWANKSEVVNWRGVIPIADYEINQDEQPEVITKRSNQQLVYQQEVAIRYLRPPTPPPPGEIIIQQVCHVSLSPPGASIKLFNAFFYSLPGNEHGYAASATAHNQVITSNARKSHFLF